MSTAPILVPKAVAAQKLANDYALDEHSKRGAPWRDIPEDALPFSKRGGLDVSASVVNTQELVITYNVPRGFRAVLSHIFNTFTPAANFVNGSGDVIWSIDINIPLSGNPTPGGRKLTDYGRIDTQLGDFAQGPWPLDYGERFNDGDVIRYKMTITNAALIQPGARVYCMLIGWVWPGERLGRDA